jgi:hypothetical protein
MKQVRRAFGISLLVILSAAAGAADKRAPLDTGQSFVINWSPDWVVGPNPDQSLAGTVTIHGADARQWRLIVSPLPPHPTLTGDVGNLRIYVRTMARGIENSGAQVDGEHRSIDGVSAKGFYFQAQDTRKKTKAQIAKAGGEFTHTYLGALNVGSKPYLFEVAWIQGAEAPARTALAAVKTIRIQ